MPSSLFLSTVYLFLKTTLRSKRFPGGPDGKASACNAGDPGSSLGQEDPLEKGKATHSSIFAWRSPWTGEPGRLVHGVAKSRTRLSDFTFTFLSRSRNSHSNLKGGIFTLGREW